MTALLAALSGLASVLTLLSQTLVSIPPNTAVASITQETALIQPQQNWAIFTNLSNDQIIDKLIECESGGKSVKILDVNGEYSYGILQIQMKTWDWWSKDSGIVGDPMNPEDARKMADWAINHGYIRHWSCFKKIWG